MRSHEIALAAYERLTMQSLGRGLSKEEKVALSLAWDNRPVNDMLEEMGIGGFYEPIFPLLDKEAELAERQAKTEAYFQLVGDVYGLDENDYREMRPEVSYWQRFYVDAKEAGMTDDDIVTNMIENMGRSRQAAIFGVETLDEFDWEKDFDEEELAALARGAEWDAGQFDLIKTLTTGARATSEEIERFVLWGAQRLTKEMQRELGIETADPYPNRKPYPGYEVLPNAQAGLGSIREGVGGYLDQQPSFAAPPGLQPPSAPSRRPPGSLLDQARRGD